MEPETLNFYVDKFIATAHECYRRVQRGEYLYANELLLNMKKTLFMIGQI